jgi:hypothetical protein
VVVTRYLTEWRFLPGRQAARQFIIGSKEREEAMAIRRGVRQKKPGSARQCSPEPLEVFSNLPER